MKELNFDLNLQRKANTLSIAEQQLVELLRGMMRNAQILILDEPTSSLTFNEVQSLFKTVEDPVSYTHLRGFDHQRVLVMNGVIHSGSVSHPVLKKMKQISNGKTKVYTRSIALNGDDVNSFAK